MARPLHEIEWDVVFDSHELADLRQLVTIGAATVNSDVLRKRGMEFVDAIAHAMDNNAAGVEDLDEEELYEEEEVLEAVDAASPAQKS